MRTSCKGTIAPRRKLHHHGDLHAAGKRRAPATNPRKPSQALLRADPAFLSHESYSPCVETGEQVRSIAAGSFAGRSQRYEITNFSGARFREWEGQDPRPSASPGQALLIPPSLRPTRETATGGASVLAELEGIRRLGQPPDGKKKESCATLMTCPLRQSCLGCRSCKVCSRQ